MLRSIASLGLGCLALLGMVSPSMSRQPSAFPAPKTLGPVETYGANIQRSMSLMASSTGLKRNTVRVLFYGQSISAQDWSRVVAERLRRQFPLTDFVIENRAIGGYESLYLAKTAEADLYPNYPDLVIFHAFGHPEPYEVIIRRIRERTTSDILHATDHLSIELKDDPNEETDPAKLGRPSFDYSTRDPLWGTWRNQVFLPAVSRKYGTELADVRGVWKRYLKDNKLTMLDLLKKEERLIHLNEHGNYLMAEIIQSHLRRRPELPDDAWNDRMKTYSVGPEGDLAWKNGKLVLPFEGNKVDLICKEGSARPAAIRIDGKKPSEFPELYAASRTEMVERASFPPVLLRVLAEKPPIVETWILTITDFTADGKQFRFKVRGSITGEDGEGESGKRFVSKSGRVAIDSDDFLIWSVAQWSRDRSGQAAEVRWQVEPYFADEFTVPAKRNPFGDTVVIAAQGLLNGKHTLEITGGPDTPLAAIRIHRPPLGRQ